MRQWMVLTLTIAAFGLRISDTAAADPAESDLNALLDAIAAVESNHDSDAVGDNGRAIGAYQIHKLYWEDATRILGVDWGYEEARDPAKARQAVRAYLLHYGRGKSLLEKARIHNGGPRGYRKRATLSYARKIARVLEQHRQAS